MDVVQLRMEVRTYKYKWLSLLFLSIDFEKQSTTPVTSTSICLLIQQHACNNAFCRVSFFVQLHCMQRTSENKIRGVFDK